MSSSICAIGDASALQPRPASQPCVISPHLPSTVQDVLNALDPTNKSAPMMSTTANHLSEFANLSINKLPLEFLLDVSPSFALYLKERRYSANSVRTYCQHARRLLAKARELGWSPEVGGGCVAGGYSVEVLAISLSQGRNKDGTRGPRNLAAPPHSFARRIPRSAQTKARGCT